MGTCSARGILWRALKEYMCALKQSGAEQMICKGVDGARHILLFAKTSEVGERSGPDEDKKRYGMKTEREEQGGSSSAAGGLYSSTDSCLPWLLNWVLTLAPQGPFYRYDTSSAT